MGFTYGHTLTVSTRLGLTEFGGRMGRQRTPYEDLIAEVFGRMKSFSWAVLVPILGPLLFAAQCLGVAHFDTEQARILFVSSPLSDALRALLLLFLPFTLESVAYVAMVISGHQLRSRDTRSDGLGWLCGGL